MRIETAAIAFELLHPCTTSCFECHTTLLKYSIFWIHYMLQERPLCTLQQYKIELVFILSLNNYGIVIVRDMV